MGGEGGKAGPGVVCVIFCPPPLLFYGGVRKLCNSRELFARKEKGISKIVTEAYSTCILTRPMYGANH